MPFPAKPLLVATVILGCAGLGFLSTRRSENAALLPAGTPGEIAALWPHHKTLYAEGAWRLIEKQSRQPGPDSFRQCLSAAKSLLGKPIESDDGFHQALFRAQDQCTRVLQQSALLSGASPEDKLEAAATIAAFFARVRAGIVENYEEKPVYVNVLPEGVDPDRVSNPALKAACLRAIEDNNQNARANAAQDELRQFLQIRTSELRELCLRIERENPKASGAVAEILQKAGMEKQESLP